MPVAGKNLSFNAATKKHENHSEVIDLISDRSSFKEAQEKEQKEKKTKRICF